jgi:NADH-quinone oxidoreductase subunit M
MIQRAFYGPVLEQYNGVKDADILERVYMFAFVALIMLVGIYPAILTDIIKLGIAPIAGLISG